MTTWDRLRVFAALAEQGSIAGAAKVLHITGPAVSQHVRKLEHELRCRLTEPDGRRIRLTTAGEVVASHARTMAAAVDATERELANIDEQVVGPLVIGGVASALRTFIPEVLRTLTAQYERLEPGLRDGEVVDMIPALRERRLDAVIVESWSNRPARMPPGIRLTDLISEDVHLAVSDRHHLARRSRVTVDELHDQTWTSCAPGSDPYEAIVQLLHAHNVDATVRYCVADYSTQLMLVAADLAVALVPRMARTSPPPGITFVPCEPAVARSIAVATTSHSDTPALRAFLRTLRDAVERNRPC